MTMNRRGLLGLFAGAGAAGATGISPREAMGALRGLPLPVTRPDDQAVACSPGSLQSSLSDAFWRRRRSLLNLLDEREETLHRLSGMGLPPHIAGKRSWSEVYKRSEAAKEMLELRRMRWALEDETVVDRIAGLLGIE